MNWFKDETGKLLEFIKDSSDEELDELLKNSRFGSLKDERPFNLMEHYKNIIFWCATHIAKYNLGLHRSTLEWVDDSGCFVTTYYEFGDNVENISEVDAFIRVVELAMKESDNKQNISTEE